MGDLASFYNAHPATAGWNMAEDRRRAMGQQDQETQMNQMKLSDVLMQREAAAQKQKKLQEIAQLSGGDPVKAQQLFMQAGLLEEAKNANSMIPKVGSPERTPDFAQLIQIRDAYAAKGDTRQAALIDAHIAKLNATNEPKPTGMTPADRLAREKFEWMKTHPNQGGRGGAMSPTAQKEIITTDDEIQGSIAAKTGLANALLLNDKAMGFVGAGALSTVGTLLPESIRPDVVDATQNLDNIITSNVLPQLKSTFGAMPTEGERKVLLDVQGSVGKSPAVRKAIFERAQKAIDARLKFSKGKLKALKEGTYFSGGNNEPAADDSWSDL